MKRVLAMVVVTAFFTTACTGSFNMTRKVYDFHRSQDNKWADEIVFLIVAILPVYGLATLGDAVIFNTIEFWTGDNPVAYNSGDVEIRTVKEGDDRLIVAYNRKTGEVVVTPMLEQGSPEPFVLDRQGEMVLAKNTRGDVIFTSQKTANGDVLVHDGNGQLVRSYEAQMVETLKNRVTR